MASPLASKTSCSPKVNAVLPAFLAQDRQSKLISSADMLTRYASPIYRDEPAFGPDATCVAALRAAGVLIMGKTGITPFPPFFFVISLNIGSFPHLPTFSPGFLPHISSSNGATVLHIPPAMTLSSAM